MEKLINNPLEWFGRRSGVSRLMLVLSLIPMISAASILSYQNLARHWTATAELEKNRELQNLLVEVKKLHDAQVEEIQTLRQDMTELKKVLQLTTDIGRDNLDLPQVLGDQIGTSSAFAYLFPNQEEVNATSTTSVQPAHANN